MKKTPYIIVLLIVGILGNVAAQNPNFIKKLDTLQNESVLITLLQQDSTFVKQYLAVNPIDTSLLFNNIVTSFPPADVSNPDYEIENTNLLGDKTSALPWDICYNPDLDKYYIYNYRKIMIYNNSTGLFETPVEISDYDEIYSELLETKHSKRLLYYNNYLYCTGNEGKLIVVNCTTNQIATEFQVTQVSSVYKANLQLVGSYIYWYYCSNANQINYSYIRKVSGTSLSASLNLTNRMINDWTFDESSNVYLATEDGLFKYSSALSQVASNSVFLDMVNIEYFNNGTVHKLIARSDEVTGTRLFAYTTNLADDHQFNTTCDVFFNMKFNASDNAIHFTGALTHSSSYYGKIKYNSSTNEFYEYSYLECTTPMALEINSTDAWVGSKNKIIKIDQANQQYNYPIEGVCTSIAVDNNQTFKLFGTTSLSGDFFMFDNQMNLSVHETGGTTKGVCQKLDKNYYIVNKGNGNGYVLCRNKYSTTSISLVGTYFDPVAIFCFNEDEQTDIIVAYEGRNANGDKRLMFAKIRFSTSDISVLTNLDFSFEDTKTHYLVKHYDGRIYFTKFWPNTCGDVPLIYFYYTSPASLGYTSTMIANCPDLEYDQSAETLYALDRCHYNIFTYNADNLNYVGHNYLSYDIDTYEPYSLSFSADGSRILISAVSLVVNNHIRLLEYNQVSGDVMDVYTLNNQGIIATDLTLGNDDNVYGFSKSYWFKIDEYYNKDTYNLPENIDAYDVHYDGVKNLFYIQSINNTANEIETFILDADNSTFLSPVISNNKYLINTIDERNLSYYNPKRAMIYAADGGFVSSSTVTCPYTRTTDTPWQWLSFPRLQRTGNYPVVAIPVLEEINPLPDGLLFRSNEGGLEQNIARINGFWQPLPFNEILSTKGYKLNIQNQGSFTHTMYGTDLNLNTPVPLYANQNGNPENWIGYFMPQPLEPEDAFVGVWDYLTEIQTQDWTMVKTSTGEWRIPSNVTPLEYGDAVIVKVTGNCTLYWNEDAEPAEEEEKRGEVEFFSYVEYSDYTPWYIETDSLQGVQEIALLAGDSCIGASVMLPGDTLIEVNAYTQAVAPGTSVEIASWDGLKSTTLKKLDFLVDNILTGARESRQVFTGEGQAYYYITFGEVEDNNPQATALPGCILNISPNPCKDFTNISFSLERDAHVEIVVTAINGKPVATLTNGSYSKGVYQLVWRPNEQSGNLIQNGIYIVRLIADDKTVHNDKVVLIR